MTHVLLLTGVAGFRQNVEKAALVSSIFILLSIICAFKEIVSQLYSASFQFGLKPVMRNEIISQ